MNAIRDEVVEQFRQIMIEETSLVVNCQNDSNAFQAIRTSRTRDAVLDEMVGRKDPQQFIIRAIADEVGTVRPGKSITVDGEEANVVNANPDSVGAIVEIVCQKRRLAA